MKLQAHHIRALKGQRKLVQINVNGAEQAEAATAAGGIDIVVNGDKSRWSEVRKAAPNIHLCLSLRHGAQTSRSAVLTEAFAALEAGADSVYCSLSPRFIEAMAREGIPVCAHAGLVPPKARVTGMRGFAKTAGEAKAVFRAVKEFESAGAEMVELECVAAPITALITNDTPMTTVSIGSGPFADVQYLFGCDILGEPGFRPRHARAFDNFAADYALLQTRRIAAFAAFRDATRSGSFPTTSEVVHAPAAEVTRFADWIQKQV
jgi:3-methyl-2-oxobutanoate hydroxymethyltransferase